MLCVCDVVVVVVVVVCVCVCVCVCGGILGRVGKGLLKILVNRIRI